MRQAPPRCAGQDILPSDTDLLNAVNAGVLVLDAKTGKVLTANDRARALLCVDGELPSMATLFPRQELSLFSCEDGISGMECRVPGANGLPVPVLLASRSICRTDGQRLVILTLTDLSLLRRAEARYQSFFENVIEGVFQSTQSGHYLMVNPGLASILGFDSPAELITHFKDLRSQLYVDPADRDTLFCVLRETGQITGFETQFICKDGSAKWISLTAREVRDPMNGDLLYIEGLNIDITARK